MRFVSSLFIVVAAVIATPLLASASDKSEADARAAMALAKAKAARPAAVAATRPIPYADAVKIAKRDGKPIFVTVGLDCQKICAGLRPEVITCHESTFEGTATRRAMLLIPSGSDLWKVREWQSCPPTVEVKAEVQKHARPRTEAATAPLDWDQAVTAMLVAMTSLEFEADGVPVAPVQYRQVCDGFGNCWEVPVGYQRLPASVSGGVASAASPPVARESAAGGRIFRFPRVAAFRQRVRGMVGLPAPVVRGQFFDALEADLQATPGNGPVAVSVGVAPAAKAGATIVGAGRERVLLKRFLKVHGGLTDADLAAVEAKGDGSIMATLIKLLVEYGIPIMKEFLEAWLNR